MKNLKNIVFLCVGGDARQIYMCKALAKYGKVYSYGIDSAKGVINLNHLENMPEKADVLVLPMMTCKGTKINCFGKETVSCGETVSCLKKNALVLGGRLGTDVIEFYSALGFDVCDFFNREELTLKNCIPTAEGALMIAMQEIAGTIFGSKVLVIGYGRVGKAVSRLFKNTGAKVCVCARRLASRTQAETEGLDSLDSRELYPFVSGFHIIINTVPALIINDEILSAVSKDTLIIDLASKPGGVDFDYAKEHNKKVIHALALPGKSAPITAGEIIAETVVNIIDERRKNYVS